MQDKPTSIELLEALAAFLREELAPTLQGSLRFKALVGANVAGIVAREIAFGPDHDRAQLERLAKLLGKDAQAIPAQDTAATVRQWSQDLCTRIDAGHADTDPWRTELLAHLRACVHEKLAIDNPTHK